MYASLSITKKMMFMRLSIRILLTTMMKSSILTMNSLTYTHKEGYSPTLPPCTHLPYYPTLLPRTPIGAPMSITNALTGIIAQATKLIQTHADKAIGNMTIEKALDTIERMQAIRDREAIYAKERACKSCIKKAHKRKG